MSPPVVEHQIILAHPDPESFCASVAWRWMEKAQHNRQHCALRDLYAEGFDPLLKASERPGKPGYAPSRPLLDDLQHLQARQVLILVYPVWFGTPPAMMKGYIERMFSPALTFARQGCEGQPLNKLRLVQISTSACSASWLAEKGVESALHTLFDRYLADVLGVEHAYHLHLDSICEGMSREHGAAELARVDLLADKVCAEANAVRWQEVRAH